MIITSLALSLDVFEKASFLSKVHSTDKSLEWFFFSVGFVVLSAVPLLVELSIALWIASNVDLILSTSSRVCELLDMKHSFFVLLYKC